MSLTELTAAGSAKLTLRAPLTIVWRFGLACLLAALAFLPYVLSILSAVVPRWGGYLSPPLSMGGGIGSPGGGRSLDFSYQPWGTLLVAALFALLMDGKLLMDNRRSTQGATRWRSGGAPFGDVLVDQCLCALASANCAIAENCFDPFF